MQSQVPLEEGDRDLTEREEGDGEMAAEIGVMWLYAQECWQLELELEEARGFSSRTPT